MKYCVYILCCNDNKYYIGSTNSLNKRLNEHNKGEVSATRKRRPINLIFYQEYPDRREAYRIELWIKRQKSKKLIDQIISEGIIKKSLK